MVALIKERHPVQVRVSEGKVQQQQQHVIYRSYLIAPALTRAASARAHGPPCRCCGATTARATRPEQWWRGSRSWRGKALSESYAASVPGPRSCCAWWGCLVAKAAEGIGSLN